MPFASRFLTFIFATAIALSGCAGPLWEPPIPGSVIVERLSPDNILLARVTSTKAKGTYNLEVRNIQTGDVIAERTIAAPVGYHAHLVSLVWSEGSRTVTATIDHDFGEDKRLLELRTDHITVLNDKKSDLKKELSTYILKLYKAAQKTKRAEDRRLYEKYLAGAAVIRALAEEGSEKETIMDEIQAHERLWGNTWLVDDVYKSPSNAWQKVKEAL